MSISTSIASGAYTIRSAVDHKPFIGGHIPRENLPRDMKIVSLPRAEERTPHEWIIERRGKDGYILKARSAPAVVIKDLVYGSFDERVRPETWEIEPVPQHGRNQYLIMRDKKKGPRTGWVLPSAKADTQVAIRNLTGLQSKKFPSNERFIIESLAALD